MPVMTKNDPKRSSIQGLPKKSHIIIILISSIPFIYLVYLVVTFSVDLPYRDSWDLIPYIEKVHSDNLTPVDLWAQHNEHRIFFPRIIMLLYAELTHWDIKHATLINILLGALIFSSFAYLVRKTTQKKKTISLWIFPVLSLIIFSLNQWENWFHEWQMQIFLSVLLFLNWVIIMSSDNLNRLKFFAATILAVISTYSFSNGLIIWPIGALLLVLKSKFKRNNLSYLFIWVASSIVIYISYFINYQRPLYHPPLLAFTKDLSGYVKYVLVYLGTPVAISDTNAALFFGFFGLFITSFAYLFIIKNKLTPFSTLVPYMCLTLYVILSALITGIGRAGISNNLVPTSRYATISQLLWLSIIVLLFIIIQKVRGDNLSLGKLIKTLSVISIFLIVYLICRNTIQGSLIGIYRYKQLSWV